MSEPNNITELVELKPDYMGFIFYSQSKRYIGNLHPDTLASISPSTKKTGVFVNEAMDVMADQVIEYDLDAVQLHGDESAEFCRSFKKFLQNMQTEKHVELIKAFGVDEGFDFSVLDGYEDFVDYFLFDTRTTDYGGSGFTFDWKILENYRGQKPYFLSGGLSLENIDGISEIRDMRFHGIDLNSKFEVKAGVKDINKLRSVFEKVRNF